MAINLGNILSNSNGGTALSGIASNFDSSGLIDELVAVKRIPAIQLEADVETNTNKLSSFNELRTILDNFRAATDFLRNPPGITNSGDNLFEYRKTALTSAETATPNIYVTATADPGTTPGNATIAIQQLALAREIRSNSFTDKTSDVVTGAAGFFTAGTMYIAGNKSTATDFTEDSTDNIATTEYNITGTGTGIVTAAGINNITTVGGDGAQSLQGTVTVTGANFDSGNITLTTTINGVAYTSNTFSGQAGLDSLSVAGNQLITFTEATSGTTFDIQLGATDYLINDDPANVQNFIDDLTTGIAGQDIYQSRQVGNFGGESDNKVVSPLTGLASTNVKLSSNAFDDSTNIYGSFGTFSVTRNGLNDTSISVDISGETYQVTGLQDSHTANIVLTSTTTNKTLSLNINDASVTLDLSTDQQATNLQNALDHAFGTRPLAAVTVETGDRLIDIQAKINAFSNELGVEANILKISDTDFRLTLDSSDVGIDNSFSILADGGAAANVTFTDIQTAQDASLTVDGLTVTRSSNTINDVIEGLSLNLLQPTPDFGGGGQTNITVKTDVDTSVAENGIINFINVYNEFRVFAARQTARDDTGALGEDAVLGDDITLRTLIQRVSSEISNVVAGADNTNFSALANVGITLTDFAGDEETPETSNILTYDPAKLQSSLANSFDNLRQIFEFSFVSDNIDISLYKRSNSTTITDFRMVVDVNEAVGSDQVKIYSADGATFLFNATLSGSAGSFTITGNAGTSLEGASFVYTGDGTDIINIDMSAGVSERLFNIIDETVKENGVLDTAVEDINKEDERLADEITRIDSQVDLYRNTLIEQFASLEEAISRVNNLLNFLDAQTAAQDK